MCVCEAKSRFFFAEAGVVLGWEQSTGLLYATGDVRYIRVWDTHKEMKIQVGLLTDLISLSGKDSVNIFACSE